MTSTTPPLILASGSKVRAALLRGAGLIFEIVNSHVDEAALKRNFKTSNDAAGTDAIALMLAHEKALSVSRAQPNAMVIGADQILSCDAMRYDKPNDLAQARTNLMSLRNRVHFLHSAVVLAAQGQLIWSHCARAELVMRDFTDTFLDAYLAALGDQVLTSVGCYQLEGPGVQLFAHITGDYFTILGLPLLALLHELRSRGVVMT